MSKDFVSRTSRIEEALRGIIEDRADSLAFSCDCCRMRNLSFLVDLLLYLRSGRWSRMCQNLPQSLRPLRQEQRQRFRDRQIVEQDDG